MSRYGYFYHNGFMVADVRPYLQTLSGANLIIGGVNDLAVRSERIENESVSTPLCPPPCLSYNFYSLALLMRISNASSGIDANKVYPAPHVYAPGGPLPLRKIDALEFNAMAN